MGGWGEEGARLLQLPGLGMALQRAGMVHANQKHMQRLRSHTRRLQNEGSKAVMCLLRTGLSCTRKEGMLGTKPAPVPHLGSKGRRWEPCLVLGFYFWTLEGLETLRYCGLRDQGNLCNAGHLTRLGGSHL